MFYQIKAYLKFLLKSTNQHGIHSPFVFDLVTKCFYDKTIYKEYKEIVNTTQEIELDILQKKAIPTSMDEWTKLVTQEDDFITEKKMKNKKKSKKKNKKKGKKK